ncbi:ERF family protein [Paenibacillus ginsengarvi]|uniref:Uncharacterized protein n=1 Tax=Paenibacillus ginsengarvi TaxID=400777 RepID=A0A3B0CSD4_9BACL|nr:ERF family protein [Paenibacillus ginsengarvi]RKN86781.1 hypothetical protein D7M11_02145 [Paenibacillus ginsengarvi]
MEHIPFDVPTTDLPKLMQPPFGYRHDQWLAARRDLALKKSKAREMVKRIAKNGTNEEHGYSFVEAADVYDLMRPILAECQLGFEVEFIQKRVERAIGSSATITDVDLLITYMDLETGYFEQKILNATGLDHGDKGIYKAYTGGEKYALIIEFMIPTGGDAEGGRPTKAVEASGAEQEPPQEPAISSEQIGQIKLKVETLCKVPGEPVEQRTRRVNGMYSSLAMKLQLKELNVALLSGLSEGQAEIVLQHLDEWLENRRQFEERKGVAK